MSAETIGVLVLSLGALLGILSQIMNLFGKPMKELTEAIHSLKLVVERLIVGQERIDNELQFHDQRLTTLEHSNQEIRLNCARRNHDQ